MHLSRQPLYALLCLAYVCGSSASFFGDHGGDGKNYPHYHSSNLYDGDSQYDIHRQFSLNTEESTVDSVGETESLAFYSSDDEQDLLQDESIVRSDATTTTLSDTTIFCSGGSDTPAFFSTTVLQQQHGASPSHDRNNATNNDRNFAHNQYSPSFLERLYEETDDDETDDEEDDDGDDGANLMLANASLQRRSSVRVTSFASASSARSADSAVYTAATAILPFGSWRRNQSSAIEALRIKLKKG